MHSVHVLICIIAELIKLETSQHAVTTSDMCCDGYHAIMISAVQCW